MESKHEGVLTQILEQIKNVKNDNIKDTVEVFISTLFGNGITHMCLFAEDDYAEVPIMYYAFIDWGTSPVLQNKEFFLIKSPKGYKILYKYFSKGAVEFMPDVIDGSLIS